jgi:hypothetical protein
VAGAGVVVATVVATVVVTGVVTASRPGVVVQHAVVVAVARARVVVADLVALVVIDDHAVLGPDVGVVGVVAEPHPLTGHAVLELDVHLHPLGAGAEVQFDLPPLGLLDLHPPAGGRRRRHQHELVPGDHVHDRAGAGGVDGSGRPWRRGPRRRRGSGRRRDGGIRHLDAHALRVVGVLDLVARPADVAGRVVGGQLEEGRGRAGRQGQAAESADETGRDAEPGGAEGELHEGSFRGGGSGEPW